MILNYFQVFIFVLFPTLIKNQQHEFKQSQDCSLVKQHLKDFQEEIPHNVVKVENLRLCSSSAVCCTNNIIDELVKVTAANFQMEVEKLSTSLISAFSKKYKKFDEFFLKSIKVAKLDLNQMFIDTYGDLYSHNSDIFMNLFSQMKDYFKGSPLSISEIFDDFFTEVMLKVFELQNPSYNITDKYKECIAANMDVIQPFAEVPEHLVSQFRRAFVATKAFVKGLEDGISIAKRLSKFQVRSGRCEDEMMEMFHCSTCHGWSNVRPCSDLCLRTMTNCFRNFHNVDGVWKQYIDSMNHLLNKLSGPYSIEGVLEPFTVKISEAIMTLQDNADQIKAVVIRSCLPPEVKKANSSLQLPNFKHFTGSNVLFEEDNFGFDFLKRKRSHRSRKKKEDRSKRSYESDEDFDVLPQKNERSGRLRSGRHWKSSVEDENVLMKSNLDQTSRTANLRRKHKPEATPYSVQGGRFIADLITKMREDFKKYDQHWVTLAEGVCQAVAEIEEDRICWNGNGAVNVSANNNKSEQEDIDVNHVIHPSIRLYMNELNQIVAGLKDAYKGNDPYTQNSDEEDDTFSSGDEFDYELRNPSNLNVNYKSTLLPTPRCTDGCGSSSSLHSSLPIIFLSLVVVIVT